PPSKQPMLTLLKQARAYGLGVILATQNPVDLDYKGLSNAGTWFLGRLQTERDKARVLEGLEGASNQAGSSFDRDKMEKTLAGLGSRVFLMNNVHDDQPVVFETRWAMSYLRGPLTKNQIQKLVHTDPNYDPQQIATQPASRPAPPPPEPDEQLDSSIDQRQLVPDSVEQYFVEPNEHVRGNDRLVYRPALLGTGRLHFVKSTYKVDQWSELTFLSSVTGGEMPNEIWDALTPLEQELDFDRTPVEGAKFEKLVSDLQKSKNFTIWKKELKEFLYRGQELTVWKCEELKTYSKPDEPLGDFKVRLEQLASEERDEATEKLRKKFAKKFQTIRSRIRRAEDKIEVEQAQYEQSRLSSFSSVATTIIGALLGRRSTRNFGTSVRSFGKSSKEKDDIGRAKDNLEELQNDFETLQRDFNEAVELAEDKMKVANLEYTERKITPRKSDITLEEFGICWLPHRVDSSGIAEAIY
ncbi:MAG: ATP-binding protein, partial [Mariniblastus sp.]|nr:ATP-binding protein [Mariniblastus sp.]